MEKEKSLKGTKGENGGLKQRLKSPAENDNRYELNINALDALFKVSISNVNP